MSSRNPYFKRKKCRGNVDLKRGKNVAVMSCEILQCRGNVSPILAYGGVKF